MGNYFIHFPIANKQNLYIVERDSNTIAKNKQGVEDKVNERHNALTKANGG